MKKQLFLLSMALSLLTSSVALGGIVPEWDEFDMGEMRRNKVDLIDVLTVLKQDEELGNLPQLLSGFKFVNPDFDINALSDEGALPILYVMYLVVDEKQKKEVISVLIEHGADVNKQDKTGITPLMNVVSAIINQNKKESEKEEEARKIENNLQMIDFLLEKGADPKANGFDDISPLFYAVLTNQKDILKVFLLKKPELAFEAFHFALGSRSFKVIGLIEDLGFDIKAFAVIGGVDSKPGYFEYQVYKKEKECGKVNESNDY